MHFSLNGGEAKETNCLDNGDSSLSQKVSKKLRLFWASSFLLRDTGKTVTQKHITPS